MTVITAKNCNNTNNRNNSNNTNNSSNSNRGRVVVFFCFLYPTEKVAFL